MGIDIGFKNPNEGRPKRVMTDFKNLLKDDIIIPTRSASMRNSLAKKQKTFANSKNFTKSEIFRENKKFKEDSGSELYMVMTSRSNKVEP